jgi:hypothetical protein
MGSAATSAGAAATLLTPARHAGPARRLALGAAAIELAATEIFQHHLGDVAEPWGAGSAGRFVNASKLCNIAGVLTLAASARRSRRGVVAGAAMLLAGSALARWGGFRAGFQSAADPSFTVEPQRRRVDARAEG